MALTHTTIDFFKNRVPKKMTDLGSFMEPYSLGNIDVGRALCNLGASINLMSLSVFKKMGI